MAKHRESSDPRDSAFPTTGSSSARATTNEIFKSGQEDQTPGVIACSFIRKMRGGSKAILVLGDDDRHYVVKWRDNPQGRRSLLNEVIATELLRSLAIPAPGWARVHVTREFLDLHPSVTESGHSSVSPAVPGIHLGSRVSVDLRERSIYDILPWQLLDRVDLTPFYRAFVFDLWVQAGDRRQCIYYATEQRDAGGKREFAAEMIDHGSAFGFDGVDWWVSDPGCLTYMPIPRGYYISSDASAVAQQMFATIEQLAAGDSGFAIKRIPKEWIGDDVQQLEQIVERLARRSKQLPELWRTAVNVIHGKLRHEGPCT